jgi:hypothetical protein
MNDKKLHTFRRTPDDNYTDTLYQRLVMLPQAQTAPPQPQQNGRSRKTRLAWAFAILIGGILIMAIVPGVRARLEDVVRQIGGLTVLITEDYPGRDDNPRIVPDDTVTLEEARDRLDFDFNLPVYVPEGLVLQEDISGSNIDTSIRLSWHDEDQPGRILILRVGKADPDVRWVVGPNSVTEVMVNDIPATLVHGGWSADTQKWEDNGSHDLRWQIDGVEYTLSSGNEEWGGLSEEELIKIAESIGPVEAPLGGQEGDSIRPSG